MEARNYKKEAKNVLRVAPKAALLGMTAYALVNLTLFGIDFYTHMLFGIDLRITPFFPLTRPTLINKLPFFLRGWYGLGLATFVPAAAMLLVAGILAIASQAAETRSQKLKSKLWL